MKKTRKLIAICLVLGMLLSIQISFASDNVEGSALTLKNTIATKVPSFEIWLDAKVSFKDVLYNINGEPVNNLYLVENKNGIIGYMITKLDNSKTVEFALGESPYNSYLDEYLNKKYCQEKEKINKKIKLINDGVQYGYTADDFETVNYFTRDTSLNIEVDTLKSVKKSQHNNLETITPKTIINHKIISGVPNEINTSPTIGCGPVSGINIVKYWDKNGYDNLVTVQSKYNLYQQLYSFMSSFHVGDQVATWPKRYGPGLENYFKNFSYDLDVTMYSSADYNSFVVNEVDNDRPGTILYKSGSKYGMHYVTLVGYLDESGLYKQYIIHDLRTSTGVDVYKDWDEGVNNDIFWKFYKIVPN